MPIAAALTGGNPRTLHNVDAVVALVLASPDRVEELLECVLSEDEVVRMRAGDALEKACRARPDLLQEHVPRLLADVSSVAQPSVQWHLAQILGEVALDEDQRAQAAQILERNLAAFDDGILINLTLATLARFGRDDAALRPHLLDLLRRHEHSRYASVARRARRLLAELDA